MEANAVPEIKYTWKQKYCDHHESMIWLGLYVFIFFIPIAKPPSTLGEIWALMVWLPGFAIFQIRKQRLENFRKHPWLLVFPGFYLFQCLGMAWTQDLKQGLHELNMQHYMLVIPLIAGTLNPLVSKIKPALLLFILANLIAGILTIYIRQTDTPLLNAEMYLPSPFISRPRASLFYAFCIFVWLDLPWHFQLNTLFKKIIRLIGVGIMIVALFNLEGRTGQIAFGICLPFWLVMRLTYKNRGLWLFAFYFLTVILAWLSFQYIGNIQRRFQDAWSEVEAYQQGFPENNANETSFARRFVFLEKSWIVFRDNIWTGVGTGDLQMSVKPLFEGHPWGIEANKPHNQFLETGVKFGLLGLSLFILGWGWQSIHAEKRFKVLYTCFTLLCIVSMLSESTLDTQAGISFFMVFNSLLLMHTGHDSG